jgi:hypothetical protein
MLTMATSRLLPGGRLKTTEPLVLEAEAKLLTVPPVRVTGALACGVADSSFERGPAPTLLTAATW